eukprot:TRINITY_DN642_c0_g1_i1.p1 TRINITY_DN642_c0_g1~~TRINITY_DN642_c0_g1_i1.p1  ORF type:complete len:718 (+),score=245.60 TRINITY_DN642_c0_g1_i1:47-2200(+)
MRFNLLFSLALLATLSTAQTFLGSNKLQLDSRVVAAGQTQVYTVKVGTKSGLQLFDSGYNATLTFTNSASVSGTVTLSSVLIADFDLATGLNRASSTVGLGLNLGFSLETTLPSGSFSASLTLTPPTLALGLQVQLFYFVNATDGSNSFSSSGSQQQNVYGAVPFTPVDKGFEYTLQPVSTATYLVATVNVNAGATVFPVLYGVAATVLQGVRTTLDFGANLAVQVQSDVNTTVRATSSATAQLAVDASIKVNTSTQLAAQLAFTEVKAFFNFTVASFYVAEAKLVYTRNQTYNAALKTYRWAEVTADGTVNFLNTTYNEAKDQVVATVQRSGQYAVYFSSEVVNGTTEAVQRSLAGGATTSSRILLGSFVAAGGSTTGVSTVGYVVPNQASGLDATSYSLYASVSNTGSSGSVSLYAALIANAAYQTGIAGATTTSGSLTLSYGIQVVTDLKPGTFQVNVTFNPPQFAASASANIQLFYFVNSSDGSSLSGNNQQTVYVAVPSFPDVNKGITFKLPSISDSTYLVGSLNTSFGYPVVPVVYGAPATVQAGVDTLITYGKTLALRINSAYQTTVNATFSTTSAVQVKFNAAAGQTFTAVGAFFEITVSNQQQLTAKLVYAVNQTELAAKGFALKTLNWVFIAADGTAQVLDTTTEVDVNGNVAIVATTNHFSTYAVYNNNQANNENTGSASSTAKASSATAFGISFLLAAFAAFFAL